MFPEGMFPVGMGRNSPSDPGFAYRGPMLILESALFSFLNQPGNP